MVDKKHEITLGVLNAVHENSHITQRSMAGELGIALGLANAYLRRCIKKGLIKVNQIPANRYAYYLTPQGFSEKSRLTGAYLTRGFHFFRLARAQFSDIYKACEERGQRRIVLHGLTDLAEIAVLCAGEYDVEIVSIFDASSKLDNYSGIPITLTLGQETSFDAVLITDFGNPQQAYDSLTKILAFEKVYAPEILKAHRESNL